MQRLLRIFAVACALVAPVPAISANLVVFAAASLKDALDAYIQTLPEKDQIVVSYGSSGSLARQIELGAPADVFLSANAAWMDKLQADGLLRPGTRRDLLGNRLVLISADPNGAEVAISRDFDLGAALAGGFLAMGEVNSVPAGIYGKQALTWMGQWAGLAPHVAQTENVRAALALVARGEAPLGIVYATDAKAEPKVRQIAVFPSESHDPIVYPGAVVAESTHPLAQSFLTAMETPAAKELFRGYGFEVAD